MVTSQSGFPSASAISMFAPAIQLMPPRGGMMVAPFLLRMRCVVDSFWTVGKIEITGAVPTVDQRIDDDDNKSSVEMSPTAAPVSVRWIFCTVDSATTASVRSADKSPPPLKPVPVRICRVGGTPTD